MNAIANVTFPARPYEATDVYRTAEDLLVRAHVITANMPKAFKFTTGEALSSACLSLAEAIAWAFVEPVDNRDKMTKERQIELLDNADRCVTRVLILYRMAQRLGSALSRADYIAQVDGCKMIMDYLSAWRARL